MVDIQNQVVIRRIAPVFAVECSDKRFLLAIALFNNLFSLRTIDIAQTHHTRNSVRQRRDNLNMKRSSNSSEEKLSAAPEDHYIVSRGNFRNRRTDHFVINAAVLFDTRQLFRPDGKLLINHHVHSVAIDKLKIQNVCGRSRNLTAAAAGQSRNRDNRHMLYSEVYALPRNRHWGYEHHSRSCR